MAPIPFNALPISEKSALPVSISTSTSTPTSVSQTKTKTKKRCPLSVTMRVSLIALFGLVYVGASLLPNAPCPGHMSAAQIPADAQVPAADASTLSTMLNAASPEHLHELLHSYLPDKYRHGVYESDRSAVEMLHKRDARLATTLVQMAKRQSGGNSTTTSAAPSTTETTAQTTLPSTSESSETSSAASSTSSPATTTTDAATTSTSDITSTTSATPSFSSTSDLASSTTTFENPSTFSTATTSEEASTTDASVTTSASLTTFTSTDSAGNVEIITSTSMVVVHASHSSAAATTTHSADLQSAAVGTRPVTGLAVLAAVVGGLLAL